MTGENIADQTSLESSFNNQDSSSTKKFVTMPSLRKCRICKKIKNTTEFRRKRRGFICKECAYERYNEKYKKNHPERIKAASRKYHLVHKVKEIEDRFLYRNREKYKGFYYGTGICLISGELYPTMLENHHVVPWDNNFVVSVSANFHRKYKASNKYAHMIAVLNAIENSKFLWDSDGQPKGLKVLPMWTADLPLKEAIKILKSYDLLGYEPIGVEV